MKRFTIIISFIMLTFMPLMAQVKQTIAVLGDSYSTFEGFIPKGYATWYSPTTPPETTDVNKVEQASYLGKKDLQQISGSCHCSS